MSADGLNPQAWVAILIALALGASVIRLTLWRRSAPVTARTPGWRLAALTGLQLAAGGLVYLTLFPPSAVIGAGMLIVATAGAPDSIATAPRDVLVALPEAGEVQGAVRVPDLATALRQFPGSARIRVEGNGLPPRDQGPVPIPLDFEPPPRPRGLVDLAPPSWTAPGASFSVGGQVGTLPAGAVELVDPSGAVVDRAQIVAGQRFVVGSNTRAAGLSLFTLRLRDPVGGLVEQVSIPVESREQVQPRVLVLAGAPSAETKYLRRWADDAGIDLNIQIDLGAGVQLADRSVSLTRATLAETDLAVVDDRRWESLDAGARSALISAVDGGLGLLLRPTGPLSAATRRDWANLGLPLTGGQETVPLRLDRDVSSGSPEAEHDAALESIPEMARRNLGFETPDAVSLLRGADGTALASWRSRDRGRVGVWTVADSYVLVLGGRPDRYGDMWSALFSALARPDDRRDPRIEGLTWAGQRLSICATDGRSSVTGPDGASTALTVDPATGEQACDAYWPRRGGWHVARDGGGRETPFYVQPAKAAASLRMVRDRDATLALAARVDSAAPRPQPLRARGSPWPWFALLLAVLAGLWWLERNRFPVAKADA